MKCDNWAFWVNAWGHPNQFNLQTSTNRQLNWLNFSVCLLENESNCYSKLLRKSTRWHMNSSLSASVHFLRIILNRKLRRPMIIQSLQINRLVYENMNHICQKLFP